MWGQHLPSRVLRRDPESLWGCSPQSERASQQEFHTVIFVLGDTMPCRQHRNWGGGAFASCCPIMGDGFHSDLGVPLQCVILAIFSIVSHHYCLSVHLRHVTCGRPRSGQPRTCRLVNLTVRWSFFRSTPSVSDVCLCYCQVHSVITEHNMLPTHLSI